jgi:hypothetical protein
MRFALTIFISPDGRHLSHKGSERRKPLKFERWSP